jgi:hypothetical protein
MNFYNIKFLKFKLKIINNFSMATYNPMCIFIKLRWPSWPPLEKIRGDFRLTRQNSYTVAFLCIINFIDILNTTQSMRSCETTRISNEKPKRRTRCRSRRTVNINSIFIPAIIKECRGNSRVFRRRIMLLSGRSRQLICSYFIMN